MASGLVSGSAADADVCERREVGWGLVGGDLALVGGLAFTFRDFELGAGASAAVFLIEGAFSELPSSEKYVAWTAASTSRVTELSIVAA